MGVSTILLQTKDEPTLQTADGKLGLNCSHRQGCLELGLFRARLLGRQRPIPCFCSPGRDLEMFYLQNLYCFNETTVP